MQATTCTKRSVQQPPVSRHRSATAISLTPQQRGFLAAATAPHVEPEIREKSQNYNHALFDFSDQPSTPRSQSWSSGAVDRGMLLSLKAEEPSFADQVALLAAAFSLPVYQQPAPATASPTKPPTAKGGLTLSRLQLEVSCLADKQAKMHTQLEDLRCAPEGRWTDIMRVTSQLKDISKELLIKQLLIRNMQRNPQGFHCLHDPALEREASKIMAEQRASGKEFACTGLTDNELEECLAVDATEAALQLAELDKDSLTAQRDALLQQAQRIRSDSNIHFNQFELSDARSACHALMKNFHQLKAVETEMEAAEQHLAAVLARMTRSPTPAVLYA